MSPAKVYYSDLRATPELNLPQKLRKLIFAAGIDSIDFNRQFTAIKMHFGEPGNLTYLRPNWAKVVADAVKDLGGIPFLTDCNTLYVGRRKNAPGSSGQPPMENGFSSPFHRTVRSDHCRRPQGHGRASTSPWSGEYVKEAKIGRRRHGCGHLHFPEPLQRP